MVNACLKEIHRSQTQAKRQPTRGGAVTAVFCKSAVHIVSTPMPEMGAQFMFLWASRKSGFTLSATDKIHVGEHISIRFNGIEHWVHLRCADVRRPQCTDTWTFSTKNANSQHIQA